MSKQEKKRKAEWRNDHAKWDLPLWAWNLLYRKYKGEYLNKKEKRRLKRIGR